MNVQESDFDELVAGIVVPCDYNNGEGHECDNPVGWYMIYHNCNREILCEPHATDFVAQVIYTMEKYGSVICTYCNTEFHRIAEFIRVRPV